MALSQVYTAVIGHVITAARWNNEFGNIYANGVDLAFPATKAVSFAGYTLTIDAAGATTLSSTASQGFILTPGSKSGTPSVNGNSLTVAANTFTDTNTAGSGVAALWAASSFRAPTLAASNTGVTTTDACTVYIEDPVAGTNETFTETNALYVAGKIKLTGDLRLRGSDSRTNSIIEPFTLQMQTSGTPAAGIGTGMAFAAESTDEAPSSLGALDFAFSDVGAGTEDSYMLIKLRRAGAAAVEAYRWICTNAFSAIFSHDNTANRTYTLPDASYILDGGMIYKGPTSTGTGATAAHEGTVTISASQALSGIHFYTDFTLDAGDTLTIADNAGRLCIVATGTITINGTIDGIGAGGSGGPTTLPNQDGREGGDGTSQPGGGGGGGSACIGGDGGNGGHAVGGRGGDIFVAGAQGQDNTGALVGIAHPYGIYGGGGGGAGGGGDAPTENGGAGGNGGASIVLIAPNVILGAASVLQTSGANGASGVATVGGGGGGGGGGSAGNVYVFCRSFTDNGATFTQTAGTAGGGSGGTGGGAAGRAGVKQINIYV
jgi:hypothetical protein